MSLLPIIKLCQKTNVNRLFLPRNIPKHSPIFRLLSALEDDDLGKHVRHSTSHNCVLIGSVVIASCDLPLGIELTLKPPVVGNSNSKWTTASLMEPLR